MTPTFPLSLNPSRRHWLGLAGATLTRVAFTSTAIGSLAACGGGGGGSASLPGTGGTGAVAQGPTGAASTPAPGGGTSTPAPGGASGVYAQGSISGFGSVVVNGIKFDDSAATVLVNGSSASPTDLRLGMVATIQGTRNVASGVASSIEVWSVAQGAVSLVQSTQFTVAGMVIATDASTVFEGVMGSANLSTGQKVTVWGLQSGTDGSRWRATRVAVSTASAVVTTGLVTVAVTATGTQRALNGIALTGNGVSALVAGQLVRAQGSLSANGSSLQADNLKLFDGTGTSAPTGEAELEGVVTSNLSATRFMLGAVEVDASGVVPAASALAYAVGARLEVNGVWQGRVLKATKCQFEDDLGLQEVEIEAKIEQFTSLANFVVRGQRCDGSAVKTIGNGKASDLRVGLKVHVQGTKAGDVVKLTSIEISG